MFDRSIDFTVRILSGGEKKCTVRFPTDEEWAERSRKRRHIRRDLGRGKSESVPPDYEGTNAELFAKICLNGAGEDFDSAERSKVILRIERCDVLSAERDGDNFRIKLAVPGGPVEHVVRIPMQSDVLQYGKMAFRTVDNRNTRDVRFSLEPSAELWRKVFVSVTGYANDDVPIIHKDVVVGELLQQVELAEQADDDYPEA